MPDPLAHKNAGDPGPLPHEGWNAAMDAARDFMAKRKHAGGGKRAMGAVVAGHRVLIKNESGADVGRFGILGIAGVLFDPSENLEGFQNQFALSGITPDIDLHQGKFVILHTPLADDAMGSAYIDGVCPVMVNITDTTHKFAEIADGDDDKLVSAEEGTARILYQQSGTGNKWCIVRIGSSADEACSEASPASYGAPDGNCTLASNTWTRGTNDAFILSVMVDACYDSATSTLYGIYRNLSIDACGRIFAVSAATAFTITTAQPCPDIDAAEFMATFGN